MLNLMTEETIIDQFLTPDPIDIQDYFTPDYKLDHFIQSYLEGEIIYDQDLQRLPESDRIIFLEFKQKKDHEIQQQKNKRKDQQRKFVFRKCFNQVQKNFYTKRPKKSIRKNRKNSMFYKHYFMKTAIRLNLHLSSFYNPDHKSMQKNSKSFSMAYIELVLSSPKFRKDIYSYMRNHFLQDCRKERRNKIFKLINKVRPPEGLQVMEIMQRCRMYLRSRKCKMPWSEGQVMQAKGNAQFMVCKMQGQQND